MDQHTQTLTDELKELVAELSDIAVYNELTGDWVAKPPEHAGEADNNVSADTTEDWNERRALMAQLETRYHNVSLALKKVEDKTFGRCEICNEEVEPDRLSANAASRTCKLHLERERELPL